MNLFCGWGCDSMGNRCSIDDCIAGGDTRDRLSFSSRRDITAGDNAQHKKGDHFDRPGLKSGYPID